MVRILEGLKIRSEREQNMTPGDAATLKEVTREHAAILGGMAVRILEATKEMGDPPREVLGAAHNMADYLDGSQPIPAENRHGIPHAREWDTGHAFHMVKDMTYALDEARAEHQPVMRFCILAYSSPGTLQTAPLTVRNPPEPVDGTPSN